MPAAQPTNSTAINSTRTTPSGDPQITVQLVQVVNTAPIYDDYGILYDNSYYDNSYYHSGLSNTAAAWIIGSIFIAIAVALIGWGAWVVYKRHKLKRAPRNYQVAEF